MSAAAHRIGSAFALLFALTGTAGVVVLVSYDVERSPDDVLWPWLLGASIVAVCSWLSAYFWLRRRMVAAAIFAWPAAMQPWLWSAVLAPAAFALVTTVVAVRARLARDQVRLEQ